MKKFILNILILINSTACFSPNNKNMDVPTEFTKELAMEYFVAYAKYEKVYLDESIKLNTDEKIRGDVGAAELEYRVKEKLFIVRGLLDKDVADSGPTFKKLLLERVLGYNKEIGDKFGGAIFEFDTTAHELQEDFPERINLRMDFTKPVSKTEFVKRVDALMDESFKYSQNDYRRMLYEIHAVIFPDDNFLQDSK